MTVRLLFVHNHPTKFVQLDLALLREKYDVQEWYQRTRAVNVAALTRALTTSDIVVGWFASWHTFLPTLLARALHKPSLLIVGGYDTAAMPEIGYGSQRGGIKRLIARSTMRAATALMTNSQSARAELGRNVAVGVARVTVVHHGVAAVPCAALRNKDQLAITVGNVDCDNLQRKGLLPFVQAAALLPDVPFVVIGAWRDRAIDTLKAAASTNVHFTGWADERTLNDYYARARVYVQASRHEAFALSLAEAMSFECVPVVARAGALPEVVGDTGIYLDSVQPRAIADGVQQGLALEPCWGQRARTRIVREFPLERRRDQLYALVDRTLNACG
jgi:glycosyltransferase involved in cell wall biosynthesis